MSLSSSASLPGKPWYTDVQPWRRPVQLPLPVLEYDSELKVWRWKVKLVLQYNSLLRFILVSDPPPPYGNPEEAAAATYCAALLSSCISETILTDLLTLSPEEPLQDPRFLYERTERIFKAVQMIREVGTKLLQEFLFKGKRPSCAKAVFGDLDAIPQKGYTTDDWRNIILVAVLLVKTCSLASPLNLAVESIFKNAWNEDQYPDENDFKELMAQLTRSKIQK